MAEGFVYCWIDEAYEKLYVGSRKGHPLDGYLCSKKIVKDQINQRPQDFKRTILFEGIYKDCRLIERIILQNMDAAKNIYFYNEHNADEKFYNSGHTIKTRKKMSESASRRSPISKETSMKLSLARRGKKRTAETCEKISKARMGIVMSKETRKRMSEAGKKREASGETKKKMSMTHIGHTVSLETRQKISNTKRKR